MRRQKQRTVGDLLLGPIHRSPRLLMGQKKSSTCFALVLGKDQGLVLEVYTNSTTSPFYFARTFDKQKAFLYSFPDD